MRALLVLPIALPFATAGACLALWRFPRVQVLLALIGAAGLLGCSVALLVAVKASGISATQIGSWPAPFGITLVADLFSTMMVVLTGAIGFGVVLYSVASVDHRRKAFGYYPLVHVLLAGVCGAFLTGDIFNLYVWFEVMLISSFVLLALGGERAQLEGAIKYVTLNLVSSAFFLAAVGILYGVTGTLNMADLSIKLAGAPPSPFVTATAILFAAAFGIKAAVFPLFFWLPASYHTPPIAVSALFAGLLTKVGVYALIRVFTLIFTQDTAFTHSILLWVSGLTMVTGVLGAAAQGELRRILSFHIVSQIGYMVMGLALLGPLALTGSIFYIAHHIIVKTNLFLVSGVVRRVAGSYELDSLGSLYRSRPALALCFLVPALSLAGVPPSSGFFAKLILIQSGVDAQQYVIVVTALVVGLLTLFSMTKIWAGAFWKPQPSGATPPIGAAPQRISVMLALPIASFALMSLAIGLWPAPLLSLASAAAGQLLDPTEYTRAVLRAHR